VLSYLLHLKSNGILPPFIVNYELDFGPHPFHFNSFKSNFNCLPCFSVGGFFLGMIFEHLHDDCFHQEGFTTGSVCFCIPHEDIH
jgi:hypothetical protein